ncbi:MAG: heavy-metal-associated domain-containing protein [Paludibacteraceae bacterium]
MKKILLILMMMCLLPGSMIAAEKTDKPQKKEVVVLSCDLHCQGCCDQIMKNIAWEKGVKDIVCDLKTKTVKVTYDPRKTDVEKLLKAFEKIGKPAKVIEN